jgi:tRNA-modifying protein YgfZ
VTHLTNRRVLSIRGPDAHSFLQGLMTADMNAFKEETRGAIFTTFLSVKGKIMFDAMVAKPRIAEQKEGGEIEYWMDIAQDDAQDALKHLKVRKPS